MKIWCRESESEVYSDSSCDDFLASVFWSEGCDIASFRVQECWQVSAAHIVPLSVVLVKFWIRSLLIEGEKLY